MVIDGNVFNKMLLLNNNGSGMVENCRIFMGVNSYQYITSSS